MRSRLAELLDRTEANVKRIEALQGTFPAAVLMNGAMRRGTLSALLTATRRTRKG